MRHLTTLAILLATTSLASAASDELPSCRPVKEQRVGQFNGNNAQATVQVGKRNQSITAQKRRNDTNSLPPSSSATTILTVGQIGGNDSHHQASGRQQQQRREASDPRHRQQERIVHRIFGNGNNALAGQAGGNDTQTTLQFGNGKERRQLGDHRSADRHEWRQQQIRHPPGRRRQPRELSQNTSGANSGKKSGEGGDNNQVSPQFGHDNTPPPIRPRSVPAARACHQRRPERLRDAAGRHGQHRHHEAEGLESGDANQTTNASLTAQFGVDNTASANRSTATICRPPCRWS